MSSRSDHPTARASSATFASRATGPTHRAGLALACAVALAAVAGVASERAVGGEIYRSVQPDGTVVFTDQPDDEAAVIKSIAPSTDDAGSGTSKDLPPNEGWSGGRESLPDSMAAPADGLLVDLPDGPTTQDALAVEPMAGIPIESVEIASPPPDATLIDPVGPLLVEVGTAPGSLASSGLVAEVLVDGAVVASGASAISVPPLERGSHQLAVRLVDADGVSVVQSAPQMLHVRRTSVASGN